MSRPMRGCVLWLLLVSGLGLAGCQRGARIELELMVSRAFTDSHVLAIPTAVELIDARGLLFRLPVARPAQVDLVALATAPLRLQLRGELPAGHYLGLRLVFDPTVWFELPGGGRAPLAVDPASAFADLDLDLTAGHAYPLTALLDLDASVIRLGPFPDVHRFLPRLSLLAGHDPGHDPAHDAGHDAGPWSPVATDVAALPRFMFR